MTSTSKPKTIAATRACKAIRVGATTEPLPDGGYRSGGRAYTHSLTTSCGAVYMVSQEVMQVVSEEQFAMMVDEDLQETKKAISQMDRAEFEPTLSTSFFNTLCWVNQTTFPEDLEADLVKLGAPADVASDIGLAYKLTCHRNLITFYESYAYAPGNQDWQNYLCAYINHRIAQFKSVPATKDGVALEG